MMMMPMMMMMTTMTIDDDDGPRRDDDGARGGGHDASAGEERRRPCGRSRDADATRCARQRNECMWVYELLSIKRDAREREDERRERTGENGREREGVCGEK